MSVEITECFNDLTLFQYLLSLKFEDFQKIYKRGLTKKDTKETYTKIITYCKSIIRAKGTITREYNYSINTPKGQGGRLFSGSSIQGICREVRGFLMKYTTDMTRKMLIQKFYYLCKKYELKTPKLEYYSNHREE